MKLQSSPANGLLNAFSPAISDSRCSAGLPSHTPHQYIDCQMQLDYIYFTFIWAWLVVAVAVAVGACEYCACFVYALYQFYVLRYMPIIIFSVWMLRSFSFFLSVWFIFICLSYFRAANRKKMQPTLVMMMMKNDDFARFIFHVAISSSVQNKTKWRRDCVYELTILLLSTGQKWMRSWEWHDFGNAWCFRQRMQYFMVIY